MRPCRQPHLFTALQALRTRVAASSLLLAATLAFFAGAQPAASAGNVCAWDFLRPTLQEGSGPGGSMSIVEAERTLIENLELVCTELVVEDLPTALADDCVLTAASGALVCGAGGGGSPLTVREEDGAPSVTGVTEIRVTNGTLTDNTAGSVSISTGGGGGGGAPTDAEYVVALANGTLTAERVLQSGTNTTATTGAGTIQIDVADAGAAIKGVLQLAGDLGGTAASPMVVDDSHGHTGSTISALDAADTTTGAFDPARLPAATTAAQGAVVLATDGEATAGEAVQGNDARLSDARTPTAHAASHAENGTDELLAEDQGTACADGQILVANTTGGLACGSAGSASFSTLDLDYGDEVYTSTLDAGGAILELPNSTALVATDCDAAGEVGRVHVDTDAPSGQQVYVCEGLAGWVLQGGGGTGDHGALTGLGDDDHAQYALLAGRVGGQTITGGTASGEGLRLLSTSNATKGPITLGDNTSTERLLFDQVDTLAAQIDFNQDGFLRIGASGQFQPQILIIGDAWATTPSRHGEITFRYGPDGDLVFQATDGAAANTTNLQMTPAGSLGLRTTNFGTGVGVVAIANAATNPSTNPTGGGVLYADGADSSRLKWRRPNGTVDVVGSGGAGGSPPLLYVREEVAAGGAGAASVANTWNVRPLNAVVVNTIAGASLASNQVTLPAGTYRVRAMGAAFDTRKHRLRLRSTGGSTLALGITQWHSAATESGLAPLSGRFTLAASTTFELQHWTQDANAAGLGASGGSNDGEVEVFGEVWIEAE